MAAKNPNGLKEEGCLGCNIWTVFRKDFRKVSWIPDACAVAVPFHTFAWVYTRKQPQLSRQKEILFNSAAGESALKTML